MKERILVIDDDQRLAQMVNDYLIGFDYDVTVANTGADGLAAQQAMRHSAIVLDLMLPDIDGLEICRTFRATDNIPILMLTAKGDPMDRIIGLELGADDYLPKPFEPRELLARLRAILRRGKDDTKTSAGIQLYGRLEIDRDALEARIDGQRCDLTPYQFMLLDTLSQGAGRVLSRDFLMSQLQGSELEAFDRSIDVHISRIRAEIEDDPKQPRRVITVRGAGYVFARAQD